MSAQRAVSSVQQAPPPEVVAQIVANQAIELEVRQKEIAAAEHNTERQFSFANKQLEAQERDRQDERRSKDKRFIYTLIAAFSIVIVICLFFGYCISQGKETIVAELLKVLCYGGPLGAGGAAWGYHKGKSEVENRK